MKWTRRRRVLTLLVSVAFVAAVVALVVLLTVISKRRPSTVITLQKNTSPSSPLPSPSQNNSVEIQPTPFLAPSPANPVASPVPTSTSAPAGKLLIPVAGVRPEQLLDTFSAARSEGRFHDAIDIPAPKGTPVIATADGPIVKLYSSERGGITIYQLSTDGKFVYYYAHLERYADGLAEGHFARQGETIAYVGDTGNAGAGNYHLHFSIAEIPSPKDFWHGLNINPYPLLTR